MAHCKKPNKGSSDCFYEPIVIKVKKMALDPKLMNWQLKLKKYRMPSFDKCLHEVSKIVA